MSISRCTPRWSPDQQKDMSWSRGPRQECAKADQVVRRRRESHDPIDDVAAAMPELAQSADGFQPTKDLLDQLPPLLADRVPGMSRGPVVDGAALDLLRHMRRDAQGADARDKAGNVESFIAADRHRIRGLSEQQQGGLPFGR